MQKEGRRIREKKKVIWRIVEFNKIITFDYEKKQSYKLLIKKIILENPETAGNVKENKL